MSLGQEAGGGVPSNQAARIRRRGTKWAQVALASLFVLGLIGCQPIKSQIVSHELRRLAASTNQLGMDTLRALDKIEPPDRVLVFCPACLSSSLMMIMMGSSKFQVVSSLRHALYVWPMRPVEINKGFKDILEHIGTNQRQFDLRFAENRTSSARLDSHRGLASEGLDRDSEFDQFPAESGLLARRRIPLQYLIKLRESPLEAESWWRQQRRQQQQQQQSAQESQKGRNRRSQSVSGRPDERATVEWQQVNGTSSQPMGRQESGHQSGSQMNVMSEVYLQRGLSMNYNYHLLLRHYYKTVMHPVDFIRNAEETRQHINALVASSTEGKVKDLVKKETFETRVSSPKIMIISTFHFRGTLDLEMKQQQPRDKPIKSQETRGNKRRALGQGKTNEINQTRQFIETEPTLLKFKHFPTFECSVIEIPFNNRLVSLVIIMPDYRNTTDLLLTRLNAQIFNNLVGALAVKRLSLEIPVIKFDRGPINMPGLLRELGLDKLFFANEAFSTETGLNRWMRPSDVLHESSIDIGTMNPNWSQTEDRLKIGAHSNERRRAKRASSQSGHIKLDKPFFYFVLDSINGLILTMGRIRQ